MAKILTPDICVIGAGSGGLSVAAAAAAFGVPVVLIEKGKMGGDCLNYGCVPSKALIAAAKRAHMMRHGEKFGIGAVEPEIDFRQVSGHVHGVIEAIAPNDSVGRFSALGVHVIEAEARFKDDRTVVAGDFEIRARRFVVATGSSPLVPAIEGLDSVDYLTNESVFDLTRRPGHLVVIGGGPIGMELAQAHRRLGSRVTVLEAARALGKDDPELAALVLRQIRAEGVDIGENAKVAKVEKRGKTGIRVHVEIAEGRQIVDGTHLLVAAGRAANVAGLDLEKAGIEYDAQGLKVTDRLRTTNPRVYAVGDVAGSLQFTHVANYHAGIVIRALLFRLPARQKLDAVPWVTFTDPELAHVGMTETEAVKVGKKIRILRWPYAENDRAQAERRTEGHIKIVAGPRGRILGITIVGANAAEMINMWALALSKGLGLRDVAGYVAPYPTMSEIGKRAAITYFAGAAGKPLVRRLIGLLRRLG
ncbi:dihydrolipoyl dehydrogenase family protein [Allomesorhizobium camelthorni]|uniref:FAD-dependent oxidoreductase n=1 Tax=Allomesorhizobium camelthorni TaxID=475069 RepID=A0A6G4WE97_9HYPH|nr:FAD-dependent oxidoreductase [Mesorhizobium camelthorni]NGO53112.1 FAD-dependent oxidoreductase [Mesorhizobium camelthorni]